jgi:hypothetical protein
VSTYTADFEGDSQFRILWHFGAERHGRRRSPGCRDRGRLLLRLLGRRRRTRVPAGVLMSMVKSAVRMRIPSVGCCDEGLLPALNNVLQPLTSPNVYATFAYIAGDGDSQMRFSLAVTFRFSTSSSQNTTRSFAGWRICPRHVCRCEISDRYRRKHVENTLAHCAGEPLPEIAARIIRTSEAFGPITDDRTLLLVRYLGKA